MLINWLGGGGENIISFQVHIKFWLKTADKIETMANFDQFYCSSNPVSSPLIIIPSNWVYNPGLVQFFSRYQIKQWLLILKYGWIRVVSTIHNGKLQNVILKRMNFVCFKLYVYVLPTVPYSVDRIHVFDRFVNEF